MTPPTHPTPLTPLRQFRRESEGARNRGEYAPPGLLSTDQFRHAFKKLSVRVSEKKALNLLVMSPPSLMCTCEPCRPPHEPCG